MSWIDRPDSGGNVRRKTIGMPQLTLANVMKKAGAAFRRVRKRRRNVIRQEQTMEML